MVTSMRSKIRTMILDDAKQNGVGPNDYRMMAGLLRLAFHDCVGKRCDGCINMRNEDNAGKYFELYIF